jgi:hypothetical protein
MVVDMRNMPGFLKATIPMAIDMPFTEVAMRMNELGCDNAADGKWTCTKARSALCFARSNKRRRILCICTVFMPTASKPKLYNPRHPSARCSIKRWPCTTSLGLTWPARASSTGRATTTHQALASQAFAEYLKCGIFAHGFARVRCDDCGQDFLVAFSCKGRGVRSFSCTTRGMVETAAHLTDHVFPRLLVRQWVLSLPKRLRYFMQRDSTVPGIVLRIF